MSRPNRRAREALTEALRDARRAAGLTGAGLADALGSGWSQPKVSKIESGRQAISEAEVRAWAAAVGADKEMLLALRARADLEHAAFRDAQPTSGAEQQQEGYAATEVAAKVISRTASPNCCRPPTTRVHCWRWRVVPTTGTTSPRRPPT
ncbi:helix-turn-helix domain-containing protein [Nocardioides albus]|uniref:Transcriptional regulator with XRE-family HTH domain n=1 Tax=Nocardioides albus TaxID=1841 RepID=A0A7W5FBJ7_9ACTN|nr:helix-turn-helix transcriptional regulator [Nocardioides albus]MBB3092307.1 transcriptional regulator with XRE-family HTH domain [Nocardioides albus]GGU26502.1 hypothetical protein GCM10007979_26850 [Nocardioides albus]